MSLLLLLLHWCWEKIKKLYTTVDAACIYLYAHRNIIIHSCYDVSSVSVAAAHESYICVLLYPIANFRVRRNLHARRRRHRVVSCARLLWGIQFTFLRGAAAGIIAIYFCATASPPGHLHHQHRHRVITARARSDGSGTISITADIVLEGVSEHARAKTVHYTSSEKSPTNPAFVARRSIEILILLSIGT